MAKANSTEKEIGYIVTYLLLWITGVIIYFTEAKNDSRIKFHAIQAILFGIFSAIIAIILNLLSLSIVSFAASIIIWVYAIYVGYEAYSGKDIAVPLISGYAEAHSDYELGTKTEKKTNKSREKQPSKSEKPEDEDHIKALKLRFAKGEITKKQYNDMKKALE